MSENINTAVQEWDRAIDFGTSSNTYKLVRALLSQADRIDDDLEAVYDDHHINTATGESLDQFGALVNTPRNTDEPDSKYRTRVKANFAQAKTNTDFDSFVEFCATVLGTDISNLDLRTNYPADSATVTISADPAVYDSVVLSPEEIVSLLGGGVPAGHEVKAQERGTFRVKTDVDINDPDKGLTSDSISTGGTLAADIV